MDAKDSTPACDAGNSRNATNTNQADKTGESLDMGDNRGASDERQVSESNYTGNAGDKDTGRDATDSNGNLNSKLRILVVIVTCFLVTTSAPYVWQVGRFIRDYDIIRDNYRHIDRTVHLFSYANPWLNALILLYYRSVICVTHTKVRIGADTAA